jgi:hypothetical protein
MRKENEQQSNAGRPGWAMGPDAARPSEEEIAALAHELWKARGCPEGSAQSDWLRAEERLKAERAHAESMAA